MRDFADVGLVSVSRQVHPFRPETESYSFPAGMTVKEIVEATGVAPDYARDVLVAIWDDFSSDIVPEPMRRAVRPKAGMRLTITPAISGRNELALVASVALVIAAPYAGAALYGAAGLLGTSALGASLVVAGVTVAGSLAINKLLAPPQPRLQGSAATAQAVTYDIGGSSNQVAPYGRVPLIIGRHRIYPTKTANPFTRAIPNGIELLERMTFGYGPVMLEQLRIGETPVHLIEGVEVELRNVDRTATLAAYPELDSAVTAWRSGSESMTLYPDDIVQTAYSVLLDPNVSVIRTSAPAARVVDVELEFPRGLFYQQPDGSITAWDAQVRVETRPTGTVNWVTSEQQTIYGAQREPVRHIIGVAVDLGQHDVRVTRISSYRPDSTGSQDDVYLSSLRTLQAGGLPSPPQIAEIAIRVVANEQINGAIGDLNAVATRMVPKWTGTTWTAPQVTSHPAWHTADLLRGHMRRVSVPDVQIDADGLKAWADEEPQRRCDYVVSSLMSVLEVRNIIAAAGRAKAVYRDGKYSIIRDQAQGAIKQLFTPRNSWGFEAEILLPKEIHGFRTQVIAEDSEWETDELIIYADGYNASNATIFEDLELPGVVLPAGAVNGGEPWRLGRYYLAQHFLRPETFKMSVDLEHLATGMGDKVRIVHDMASIGIGQGRIKSLTTLDGYVTKITLDDAFDIDAGTAMDLTIRTATGNLIQTTATGGDLDPTLKVTSTVSAAGISVGDLVGAAEPGGFFDCIIKSIVALDDENATLELIPAAPEVLNAENGVIPAYSPLISTSDRQTRPQKPIIRRLFSGIQAAQDNGGVTADQPRIGVELESQSKNQVPALLYRLRWREVGTTNWTTGVTQAVAQVIYTAALTRQKTYQVQAQSLGVDGLTLGWTDGGSFFAFVDDGAPDVVPDFRANVLGSAASLTWGRPTRNVDYYVVRHSTDPDATWGESITVAGQVRAQGLTVPAFNGVYHIRAVNFEGATGSTSATAIVDSGAMIGTVGTTIDFHPAWAGTASGGVSVISNTLQFTGGGGTVVNDWPILNDVTALGSYGVTDPSGSYELDTQVDLGAVQTRRVTASVRAAASYIGFTVDKWGPLNTVGVLSAVPDNLWDLVIEISTTQDAGASPVWGDWQQLLAGDYTFRQAKFRISSRQNDISLIVSVSNFTVQVGTIG